MFNLNVYAYPEAYRDMFRRDMNRNLRGGGAVWGDSHTNTFTLRVLDKTHTLTLSHLEYLEKRGTSEQNPLHVILTSLISFLRNNILLH